MYITHALHCIYIVEWKMVALIVKLLIVNVLTGEKETRVNLRGGRHDPKLTSSHRSQGTDEPY